MICGKCRVLCSKVCPICGKIGKLRPVEAGEPVLLITLTHMQALLVEPLLMDAKIPYTRPATLLSSLTTQWGTMLDSYRFYVPYEKRDEARALIEEVFGEDESIMHALHEFDLPE